MVKDTEKLIPIKRYMELKNYTKAGVYYQLARNQLIGYKIRGKWYILPPELRID